MVNTEIRLIIFFAAKEEELYIPDLISLIKNNRMISVRFQDKPFNIMVIQVYAPTSNAEEAEIAWFYKDL